MMVRGHSIARVYCTPGEDPANCKGLGVKLQDAIKLAEENTTVPSRAKDLYGEMLRELFDTYGYGAAGESNSIWGRQYRLMAHSKTTGDEDGLRSAAQALGLVVQETNESYDLRDFNVFAPSLDRFLGYDHSRNAPLSDAVIVEHDSYSGPHYIEVGGERTVLDEVAAIVTPNRDERSHGVLTYAPTALSAIEQALRENERSYSIHNGCIGRLATREWCPSLQASEYLAVKKERGRKPAYQAHAIQEDSFACGTTVSDRSEYRVLRPKTVERLDRMSGVVSWCGHQACEERLPSRERVVG